MNTNVENELNDFIESFESNKAKSVKQNEKREMPKINPQTTKFMDRVILAEDGRQLLSE